MKHITIALPKGRLAEQTIALLESSGVDCSILKEKSRKLVFEDNINGFNYILVKPGDVPAYVYYGAADVGVAGKDTLMEQNLPLYEMLDLNIGECKMCICGFANALERAVTAPSRRVATKYINIAQRYFQTRGETVELIKLNGSVELAPLLGLSDVIMDIVETGRTLEENGLEVLERVCDISARVVVNKMSLKTKGTQIKRLINALERAVEER